MDQQNEYTSKKAHKPAADHPWRKFVPSSEIERWAFEQSVVPPVNSVYSARPDELRKSERVKKKKH